MRDRVLKLLTVGVVLATFLLVDNRPLLAASEPPAQGGVLPQFELTVPQDAEVRKYLGLPASGTFTIPQIKAQAVIIEIFSMY